jgi:hypothetical protein
MIRYYLYRTKEAAVDHDQKQKFSELARRDSPSSVKEGGQRPIDHVRGVQGASAAATACRHDLPPWCLTAKEDTVWSKSYRKS